MTDQVINDRGDTITNVVNTNHVLGEGKTRAWVTKTPTHLRMWLQSGQSLSVGITDGSNATVHDYNLSNAYLFNGIGTEGLSLTPISTSNTESMDKLSEYGREVGAWAGINLLQRLMGDMNPYLFAPHGKAGATIQDLSIGTVPFTNGVTMISFATERANDLSLLPEIPFITFIQGESNYADDTEIYKGMLRTIHNDYISAAHTETGQVSLPMIVEQPAANYAHNISCALLEYAQDNLDAVMSTPKYMLGRLYSSSSTDHTHLNSQGYIIQGEYQAIAAHKKMTTGESKCLEPTSFVIDGNTVRITLNVPTLPIVIDEVVLPTAPSYGLNLIKPDLSEILPTVTVDGNTLVLDAGEPVSSGWVVDCGRTLDDSVDFNGDKISCTNIRDSSSIPSIVDGWTLSHWLVEFNKEL